MHEKIFVNKKQVQFIKLAILYLLYKFRWKSKGY